MLDYYRYSHHEIRRGTCPADLHSSGRRGARAGDDGVAAAAAVPLKTRAQGSKGPTCCDDVVFS